MTAPTPDPQNDSPRFRAAFAELLTEIRAVPGRDLAPINIDITSAVTTVLGAGAAIRRLREQIVKETPCFDVTLVDRLELYALALAHAHTTCQTAATGPALLPKLVKESLHWRTVLLNDATTLISRELLKAGVLEELRGANGYKNLAFDLFALSKIYRKHWCTVASRTSIEPQELDQVENLADRLLTTAGERKRASAATAQAVRDRQAAFTLLINVYAEVRAVIAFLCRKQGNAGSIAPSLYAARSTKSKQAPEIGKTQRASPPSTALPEPQTAVAPEGTPGEQEHSVQG